MRPGPKPIRLPKVLCCIGHALEIGTQDEIYRWPIRKNVLLYTCPAGTSLFCIQSTAKKVSDQKFKNALDQNRVQVNKARKLYRNWHDFDAVSGSLLSRPRGFLHDCGRATYIIYRSDKWIGKNRDYIHHFKKPPRVRANKKSQPSLLAITGGKIRVKNEGITG